MCKHFHLQASRGSSIRICTTHTHKTTAISKQICIRLSMPAVSQRCRWVMLHLSTPRFGESLCIYQLIYCQLCWEEYLFLQWKDPTTTKDTTIKNWRPDQNWHPESHVGTLCHILAPNITCWHSISHDGTPHDMLALPHHMLASHIKHGYPTSNVGTPYHTLAPHITCWYPTS